LYSGSGIPN